MDRNEQIVSDLELITNQTNKQTIETIETVSDNSNIIANEAEKQAASIEEITAAIEEITSSMESIAQNTRNQSNEAKDLITLMDGMILLTTTIFVQKSTNLTVVAQSADSITTKLKRTIDTLKA